MCFNDGSTQDVSCIDALGTNSKAFPSSYTGLTLPAVPVLFSSPDVMFEPNDVWMASNTDINCTTNDLTYTTSLINSTVSFNYSGDARSNSDMRL